MALAASFAALAATFILWFFAASFGHHVLRSLKVEFPSSLEQLLVSAALGMISFEVLIFLVQPWGRIRTGVLAVLLLVAFFGIPDFIFVAKRIIACSKSALTGSRLEKSLTLFAGVIVLLEGFAAMAPLTGSDALHYHFPAQLLVLRNGFQPNFFLSHSFFSGQSHLLILTGLALGSAQLAMGFLFLGGVLAAASAFCLARRWASRSWASTAAIVFLVTPIVFWQISAAGAPDIWMACFATVSVLVISRSSEFPRASVAILAGALAGGVAGAKYTGCLVAASIAVAYIWENRWLGGTILFLFSSLAAGVWPYGRNFAWTGDPVFPFLMQKLSPEKVNTYALASYLADTGASAQKSLSRILQFPFFVGTNPQHHGFWEFFGPIVLVFTPLILLAIRNTPLWRAALWVWVPSALGIGAMSAMPRFVLPVFPIGVAAAVAGVSRYSKDASRLVRLLSLATVCFVILIGSAGLVLYDRQAFAAGVGITPREDYLRSRAPDYEKVEFINRTLQNNPERGNTLVFLRHVFYLRVPFVYAHPLASWAIDPSMFQSTDDWMAFFVAQDIHWVVRSPDYPDAIAGPLNQLEQKGNLVPIAQGEISDFMGKRISGERETVPIVVLKVVP